MGNSATTWSLSIADTLRNLGIASNIQKVTSQKVEIWRQIDVFAPNRRAPWDSGWAPNHENLSKSLKGKPLLEIVSTETGILGKRCSYSKHDRDQRLNAGTAPEFGRMHCDCRGHCGRYSIYGLLIKFPVLKTKLLRIKQDLEVKQAFRKIYLACAIAQTTIKGPVSGESDNTCQTVGYF